MLNKECDYCQYLANHYSKETLQKRLELVNECLNGESEPISDEEKSLPRLAMYLKGALELAK